MSAFEYRVKKLCERIFACQTEDDAIVLTRELKTLLHDRIEEIRGGVVVLRSSPDWQGSRSTAN